DRLHLASWFGNVAPACAHRNYRIYVSGNAVGLIGTWLQRVSVGWLAWTLTHSGAWLGIMSMAEFFPVVFLSPLAGVLADRRNQVNVIRTTQAIGGAQASLLVSRRPGIARMLMLFTITTIATRGYVELFPGFADDVFQRGAAGLSVLVSTVGLGAICGGAWMLRRPGLTGLTSVVLGNTLVISLAILAFAATDRFYVALPFVFVAGAAMVI